MSGDVQPRKRKDKKRKKDELSVEEPRGTAAVLGEGDVFMHSHHDHGTGGHWCAKIIFFSLLAVLVTLIGLIILENRGLSELEANAVESRYSGVLEGWLEDVPSDDHHDEHTLELKHHHEDDDRDEIYGDEEEVNSKEASELEQNIEDEYNLNSDEQDEDEVREEHLRETFSEDQYTYSQDNNSNEDADDTDEEYNLSTEMQDNYDSEEEDDTLVDKETVKYQTSYDNEHERQLDSLEQDDDSFDENRFIDDPQLFEDSNEKTNDFNDEKDDDEHDEDDDDDDHEDEEIENIEQEVSEEEPLSLDLPVLPEKDDDDNNNDDFDDNDDKDDSKEDDIANDDDDGIDGDNENDSEDDFLEQGDIDDDDDVPVEKITAPSGQPFDEIEDEISSEKPPNTLEEEEEYERAQEELRKEEEQKSSHMWMKLVIGGALLVATQAVVRRFTSARGDEEEDNDTETTEETPVVDRRMTILLEEPPIKEIAKKSSLETSAPVRQDLFRKTPLIIKSAPTPKQTSLEDEEEEPEPEPESDEEKYSDEEDIVEEEEVVVKAPKKESQKIAEPQKESKKEVVVATEDNEDADDEDVGEDVEIIDEEDVEEEEEEDVSEVDDTELLNRLEAKYGRLPEPERPGQRHKDGGNTMKDYWPEEPSNPHWHQELEEAERELLRGQYEAALARALVPQLQTSTRARWIIAQALDLKAEAKRDNRILTQAIEAYLALLKMNEKLSDEKLLLVAKRTLNRMQFRGAYLRTEPVYKLLIRRFPNDISYRNNMTVSLLMANRADLAETVLKETLQKWPKDKVALAHYGFVLKTVYNKYEEAVEAFKIALEGDTGPACESRFYYHYGDALLLLGRFEEAQEVHTRGAAHGHFLSPVQRSLYNVPRLKSRPWWDVELTPYAKLARSLESSWKAILKEGQSARALYEEEKEGLRASGEWSQLDLFVRGQEIPKRCDRAPVTCSIVRSEIAASGCRRGQIKFSVMEAGTHVRPHVGPTNCRLRMHLGLSNTKDTFIRVDKEIRQWQTGKVLLFDDSFEHEVWHNGTGSRLVLIVDVWHPDLTAAERRQLPAI